MNTLKRVAKLMISEKREHLGVLNRKLWAYWGQWWIAAIRVCITFTVTNFINSNITRVSRDKLSLSCWYVLPTWAQLKENEQMGKLRILYNVHDITLIGAWQTLLDRLGEKYIKAIQHGG